MAIRIGVEKHPVNLQHPDDRLWLQALVWPEQLARMLRLRKAIRIAEAHPPDILHGDGIELLPDLLNQSPSGEIPLVYHSFVRYQFSPEQEARFHKILADFGRSRPLLHVALEWIGSQTPQLDLDFHAPGPPSRTHLAICNPHGEWLQWRLA